MARKETLLVSFTCLLVVASVAMCANATAAPRLLASEQVNSPLGCRCCFVVGEAPNLRCGHSCCSNTAGENCCIRK
ncbi:hypothetical protein POPTR_006G002401v4 [Populus trichocarpa]|uniref:Uncharacterized protein n=1 Tax=Populus trichocarpa TaxID=3694 RepID=A0A3N7F0D8_POPTR|nr:hypothetical protein BDE02_06G002100 [Populus trichocarpa]RQO91096.1 hypothetical protein POPTR_006G002401v4 [Populus trichocarpa]